MIGFDGVDIVVYCFVCNKEIIIVLFFVISYSVPSFRSPFHCQLNEPVRKSGIL